ncbi:MAG: DUF1016 family protein [Candidatus Cloacimonetes bacterium]|nr:DUF1016 family protein [Candidatus Cloacimonadota bacterium]
MKNTKLTFRFLVSSIRNIHHNLLIQSIKAVNVNLTIRNWLIGFYISEFELRGIDRAKYGENLLLELSNKLTSLKISNTGKRQLYNYIEFYRTYPQISSTVLTKSPKLISQIRFLEGKVPTVSAQSNKRNSEINTLNKISPAVSAKLIIPPEKLINRLSYSHLALLVKLDSQLKITFYEIESIRGNWSVRELKRQIDTLYFERSGLSKNKKKLSELILAVSEKSIPETVIRDPYIFEFMGVKSENIMSESNLENVLLQNLQQFLLELGQGFCFEARPKRILIGDTHYFIDIVFYHRILKCHILIELKVDSFTHKHLGKLNTYLNFYKKNEMCESDNPPIGILLCTQKDHSLVEYATDGMDNKLFISKYKLELPTKEEIQKFLNKQMSEIKY